MTVEPQSEVTRQLRAISAARMRLKRAGIMTAGTTWDEVRPDLAAILAFVGEVRLIGGLVELYYLQIRHDAGDAKSRKRIRDYCQAQWQAGRLMSTEDATRSLSRRQNTLRRWERRRQIQAIRVGGRRFYLAEQVVQLRRAIDGLTIDEVMERLGVSYATVWAWTKCGKLNDMRTPAGDPRFDVEEVEALAPTQRQKQERLRAGGAAAILRVPVDTIHVWRRMGVLSSTTIHGRFYYLESEVRKLEHEMSSAAINAGFEWLHEFLQLTLRPWHGLSMGQVRRRLRTQTTLQAWTLQNLLPFYDRTPAGVQRRNRREYPSIYIEGVVTYANGRPMTARLLRQYRKLCAAEGIVVHARAA